MEVWLGVHYENVVVAVVVAAVVASLSVVAVVVVVAAAAVSLPKFAAAVVANLIQLLQEVWVVERHSACGSYLQAGPGTCSCLMPTAGLPVL